MAGTVSIVQAEWEFFYTKANLEAGSENVSACCAPQPKVEEVECCSTTSGSKGTANCCS